MSQSFAAAIAQVVPASEKMLAMTASLSKTGAAVGGDGGAAVGAALGATVGADVGSDVGAAVGATVGAEVGSGVIGGSTTVILAMLAISPYRFRPIGLDLGATNASMLYIFFFFALAGVKSKHDCTA